MTRDDRLNGLEHYERYLAAHEFHRELEPAAPMTRDKTTGDVAAEAKRLYEAFLPSRLRQLRPADDKDLMSAAVLIFRLLGEVERMREQLERCTDALGSIGTGGSATAMRDIATRTLYEVEQIARRALAGSATPANQRDANNDR